MLKHCLTLLFTDGAALQEEPKVAESTTILRGDGYPPGGANRRERDTEERRKDPYSGDEGGGG